MPARTERHVRAGFIVHSGRNPFPEIRKMRFDSKLLTKNSGKFANYKMSNYDQDW